MTATENSALPNLRRTCLAIVLAAGEGTRMRSDVPKVLHSIAGRSMLAHVLSAIGDAGADAVAVVVGPGREDVAIEARRLMPEITVCVQQERLGTAHGVLCARDVIARGFDDVIVAYADTPLVQSDTFLALRLALERGASVAVLGFQTQDPTGYGRLLGRDGALEAIREEKDASEEERSVRFCNAGLMALDGSHALALLEAIDNTNAKSEYYLTDAVSIARKQGLAVHAVEVDETSVLGVNDRAQLAVAEGYMQSRLRKAALQGGVTLIAPDTVFFSYDTQLGRDVVVEPHVVFGPGVTVEAHATVHAFSHIAGAHIGKGATVGPFARLRPGARLGTQVKVGNFVEIKNTTLDTGAKVGHLTYLGDADVGADANVGAGTITCNYDGFSKFRTTIGAGAFIGSNSALVAPLVVGANAYVGSGSVVTRNVPDDALAVGRTRQIIKTEWARLFREKASQRLIKPESGKP